MAESIDFKVTIPNLEELLSAFTEAPRMAGPILQRAIMATNIVFAQHTDEKTVPYKSTNLIHSFRFYSEPLRAMWGPSVKYALYVQMGTNSHLIFPSTKQALWWKDAPHPVKKVQHPGTKASPFMERILRASKPGIIDVFDQALERITQAIVAAAKS